MAWTQAQRLDVGTINAEIEKFRDWHRSKGSVFADWNAAWRTWVRKHLEWRQAKGSDPRSSIEGAI